MIIEEIVPIQVEILNHLLEVFRLEFTVAVLSLELGQRCGINITSILTINAFEGSIWFEVAHCREYLP